MWLQGSREGVNVTTLQTELGEEGATDFKRHGRTINLSLMVELKGVKYALVANFVYHLLFYCGPEGAQLICKGKSLTFTVTKFLVVLGVR